MYTETQILVPTKKKHLKQSTNYQQGRCKIIRVFGHNFAQNVAESFWSHSADFLQRQRDFH